MKKIISIACVLMLLLLLAGCNGTAKGLNHSSATESNQKTTEQKGDGEPNPSISVRSLEQLEEMRKMAEIEDEEALASYLQSVEGGGAHSREDLTNFLKLVDTLPVIKFMEGEITYISLQTGNATDSDNYNDNLLITTTAKNGDWTNINYCLSVKNVSAEIEKRKADGAFADSKIENPIESKNGRIKVYSETREKHVSGNGDVINWTLDVDGIFAQAVYYTSNSESIDTENVFENVYITSISEMK